MKYGAVVLAGIIVLYCLHRLALRAEEKGWIYYLHRKASASTLGTAFLEVQSLVEPEKRQLVEVRRAEDVEVDEHGEPPEAAKD